MAALHGVQSGAPSGSAATSEGAGAANLLLGQYVGPGLQMGIHMNLVPSPGFRYFPMPSQASLRPSLVEASRMVPPGPPVVFPSSTGLPLVAPGPPERDTATSPRRPRPQRVRQRRLPDPKPEMAASPKRPRPQRVRQRWLRTRKRSAKKKKTAGQTLPQRVLELVPESQTYMALLAFEKDLDQYTQRKCLAIQEALHGPSRPKRKLRVFISNTSSRARAGAGAFWELRVQGRLLADAAAPRQPGGRQKRKFSSFLKSLVIELDRDLYGPDQFLVEWHRTAATQETDGFQVRRPGGADVWCTIILVLNYAPPQFRLDPRLARLLRIHTQTRPAIIRALWRYVKTHRLQDPHEPEVIVCDKYLQQIFEAPRMRLAEIPDRLHALLMPPEPAVIHHVVRKRGKRKKVTCYDIDVDVNADDTARSHTDALLLSPTEQQNLAALDGKLHDMVRTISQLKSQRQFMLDFATAPRAFVNDWLQARGRDLVADETRRADFYFQPRVHEAVCRYIYSKAQEGQQWLEEALGFQNY